MEVKLFEIRDSMTNVSAMAIQVSGEDGHIMRRVGFQSPMVYLVGLATERARYDPYNWDNRTMRTAHLYIQEHWDELQNEDVVDVQFILGETTEPMGREIRRVPPDWEHPTQRSRHTSQPRKN